MNKKIAIVATVPFVMQVHLRAHILMLAEHADVTLITCGKREELQSLLGEHIDFIHLDVARKISLLSDWRALLSLISIFRKQRFDVVHSVMPKTGLLAMLAAYFTRVPHRIHMFTGQVWANKTGAVRWILKTFDKVIAFCAAGLLVDSFSQRAFLIEHNVVTEEKVAVLGSGSVCGVDVSRFRPDQQARKARRAELGISENDVVFLFLGRINPDKGVQDLAQAFAQLHSTLPQAHLVVVGPDEGQVDAVLQKILAPCASHFHRIGLTDKPEHYMACADVFCLPSYREGFGSVIIEAAATGLPAVASRIYGLTDSVVEGETGILHEVKNVQQIQEALMRLATDKALRNSMAEKAYQRAQAEFSQKVVVEAMRGYYQELFNKPMPTKHQPYIKRLTDLLLASVALVILFIPIVVVALLVKCTSPGPVIYWSNRVGRHNRIFSMPKFRTMQINTPAVATHLLTNPDQYLTPVGSFLRKSSLDELPQLWSIFHGDMSFVGPRPALFNQDDLIRLRTEHQVDTLVPGLTGWAQINGRDELPIPEKVALDVFYLKHRSLRFDLKILLRTFLKVIRRDDVSH